MSKISRRKKSVIALALFVIIVLLGLHVKTGVFSRNDIDARDLSYWDYENGRIVGTDAFEIIGNRDICWLLIHSYTSSPQEMRELAEMLNENLQDYIRVPRLKGHGEVPSHIMHLSLDDWYEQMAAEFMNLKTECGMVNVIGSSFGGAIALRLTEQEDVGRLYLVNPYLGPTYRWYYIISPSVMVSLLSDVLLYTKKTTLAQINDPQGLARHTAYWNMPFVPVKNSHDFLTTTTADLHKIDEPVFIAHSTGDQTAAYKTIHQIPSQLRSTTTEFATFHKSNHILLLDYDRQAVIDSIIHFEEQFR